MVPVSNDTLLRSVRRRGRPGFAPPRVVGIDDWAWRRNHRYGTIICDLERRGPIRLLPDREPATAHAWLIGQPQITTVARDRGGGYLIPRPVGFRATRSVFSDEKKLSITTPSSSSG